MINIRYLIYHLVTYHNGSIIINHQDFAIGHHNIIDLGSVNIIMQCLLATILLIPFENCLSQRYSVAIESVDKSDGDSNNLLLNQQLHVLQALYHNFGDMS